MQIPFCARRWMRDALQFARSYTDFVALALIRIKQYSMLYGMI
jgi:hypothetical protein